MKVSVLVPHLRISGGMRVLLKYADLLQGRGHQVRVFVISKNKFRRSIANIFQIGKPRWYKDFRPKVFRVDSFSKDFVPDADILFMSSYQHALTTKDFPDSKGKKVFLLQHDERLYHGDRNKVFQAYSLPIKKVAVSSWLVEMLQRDFSQSAELLLNTIDRNLFRNYNIERDREHVRVLLMHHIYKWKGFEEGWEVVNELKKKNKNIKLIVFGAREEHINYSYDEYYFNPRQTDLARIYSSCDVFLCPSWDEGFGLPSLEAMACKCAVVTYDNGGSRDFAFDNKTALVARRRDKNDLKDKLYKAVSDRSLREYLVDNAYKFVSSMLTWEEQAEKLEKIFLNELEKHA